MAVVIGSASSVTMTIPGIGSAFCVVSINWGYNPNLQRYYCIGDSTPSYTVSKPTESLSVVVYPYGGTGTYDLTPSVDCTSIGAITVNMTLAICPTGSVGGPISSSWYLNNYGFSKDDPNLPGQETWAMTAYPVIDLEGNDLSAVAPDSIIRGISEGQATKESYDADPGVTFATEGQVKASTGNVAAQGLGKVDIVTYGTATKVGASALNSFGETGNGSVSVNLTPVWY
jgi:hypothetical protein